MNSMLRLVLASFGVLPMLLAQTANFHGTVEKIDAASQRISISNEAIEGGMGAMTMSYHVEPVDTVKQLHVGDHIQATFDGQSTLSHVQVVTPVRSAAIPAGLRLEDLERLALANNPTIAQSDANLRIAAGLARQAGLYPNPTIGYYGDEIRGGSTGGGKQGAFFSQTIVTAGKLSAARRVAELKTGESKINAELQRLRVVTNVRLLFYEVLAAQRLVDVRQKLLTLATDAVQTSRQLANVGQADQPDVLQAEIEQMQANVTLRVAKRNEQAAWQSLAAVLGKPDFAMSPLQGDLDTLPDLNYEEWLAAALRDSPELRLAQQAAERADASLAQVKKLPVPDLQVYGSLTQNNELLESTRRPVGLNGGVQIGVQLPIFNRYQGSIAAARGEAEVARQETKRLKLQMIRQLASLYRDYSGSLEIVQQYKTEMLPRAGQAYRLYRTNYQNMAAAYPQVLIAQRTLFQLEVEYVQALQIAWQNLLALRSFGLVDGLSASPVSGVSLGPTQAMQDSVPH